jgi:type IV secretory pathway VirB2 component (pilin)
MKFLVLQATVMAVCMALIGIGLYLLMGLTPWSAVAFAVACGVIRFGASYAVAQVRARRLP